MDVQLELIFQDLSGVDFLILQEATTRKSTSSSGFSGGGKLEIEKQKKNREEKQDTHFEKIGHSFLSAEVFMGFLFFSSFFSSLQKITVVSFTDPAFLRNGFLYFMLYCASGDNG